MSKKSLLFFGLILFCTLALHARGGKEKETAPAVVQVTGVVRLVGSGLLNELVISAPGGEWYTAREDREKLYNLQHRTVTVEGEETITEMTFASGTPAGIRRNLRNIRIIAIE